MKNRIELQKIVRILHNTVENDNNRKLLLSLKQTSEVSLIQMAIFLHLIVELKINLTGVHGLDIEYSTNILEDFLRLTPNNSITVVSFAGTYTKIHEVLYQQFKHLRVNEKDYLNNTCIDIGPLLKASKAYYDTDDYKILIHYERWDSESLSTFINNMIIILAGTFKETNKYHQTIENVLATNNEKTCVEYLKQFYPPENPFENFIKAINKTQKAQWAQTLINLELDYNNHYSKLKKLTEEIKQHNLALRDLQEIDMQLDKIYKEATMVKEILDVEVRQSTINGTELIYTILSKMTVDPHFVTAKFIKDPTHLQFLKDIIDNKIYVNFAHKIAIEAHLINLNLTFKCIDFYPGVYDNPHLRFARCLGTFRSEMINAFKNHQFLALSMLLAQSVGQLNLADVGIVRQFFDVMFNDGKILVHITETDELIAYNDYLKRR